MTSASTFFFGDYDTSSTTKLPGRVNEASKNILDYSQGIGAQPYTPYTGQRVAGFTGTQKQAFNKAKNNVGAWKPDYRQATQQTRQATNYQPGQINSGQGVDYQQWGQGALAQYSDPYNESVINTTLANYDRDLAKKRNMIGLEQGVSGSFGGARHGIREAEFDIGGALDRAMTEAQLRSGGYAQAADLFQADKQRELATSDLNRSHDYRDQYATEQLGLAGAQHQLAGARQLAGLGQDKAALGYADSEALLGIGDRQQARKQQGLDIAYEDYLRQMYDDPSYRLNTMISGVRQAPYETTTVNEGLEPNYLGQILGAAGGIGTIAGALGAF